MLKGEDSESVTAIPDEGYRFLRWADTSSPNPTRTDTNIEKNLKPQAKFVKVSDIKYKILLVYVTEVQATFADIDGNDIVADYKMSDDDLTACRMITELFDICLNEMFNGLVTFEVDEYYTKEVMREENFLYEVYDDRVETKLFAENILEVADILKDYGSYITTVPLTYTENALTSVTGLARYKSATVRYEKNMPTVSDNGESIKYLDKILNNYINPEWASIIYTYVHEFTHTIEEGVSATAHYRYHLVLFDYAKTYSGHGNTNIHALNTTKLYLLNQAEYNGETVGIPFPVYTNNIYDVHYKINDASMGTVGSFPSPLRVAKGCDGEEMVARPWPGYRFVGWSDGETSPTRIDKNIQSDMEVTAFFEPIEYTITYLATEGGHIEGNANQKICGTNKSESVTAVAEDGYKFVGWSNGFNDEQISISIRSSGVTFDENNKLVLTAIFEKIDK